MSNSSGPKFFQGVSVWSHVPSGGSLLGGGSLSREDLCQEGGLCQEGSLYQEEGSLSGGGLCQKGISGETPRMFDERAVRILLECFLV